METGITSYKEQYEKLAPKYSHLEDNYNDLEDNYNDLVDNYNDLVDESIDAAGTFNETVAKMEKRINELNQLNASLERENMELKLASVRRL